MENLKLFSSQLVYRKWRLFCEFTINILYFWFKTEEYRSSEIAFDKIQKSFYHVNLVRTLDFQFKTSFERNCVLYVTFIYDV